MTSSEGTAGAGARLEERIRARELTLGVIGLGYVGLPLCHAFVRAGLSVVGLDVDPRKVESLRAGRSYLEHLGEERSRELLESPRFEASGDFSRLGDCDAVFVCVPTPLGPHQEPDLSYVVQSAQAIGRCLRAGQLVVLESTTYPGTTREVFWPALREASAIGQSLELGRDYYVAFSPEREDPGRKSHSTRTIPRLVGGLDARSGELAAALYRLAVDEVLLVSSSEVAEAAKLLENIFRAVNIALVNELKLILDAMGTDVWEVVQAAATKPFGFMSFQPGPGLGGHCIPIDPYYLTWKAKELGYTTRFIELAGAINTAMPAHVVQKTAEALNEAGRPVKGSRVLVLGLAYKPDIDDTRESPSFEILSELARRGATIAYHDPHVPKAPVVRRHALELESLPLTRDHLEAQDAVLIATDHSEVDYALVAEHAKLLIDTRNVIHRLGLRPRGRLVKA